ncbi:4-alpha-glucanotransferase [bacterium]|nr:4-alpha-glucanotransferase [bacterium]
MELNRCSGVLLHPTSLPGRYGIGSFDREAYEWIEFLISTEQSIWQVLPLGPTSFGDSPYQSFSTHAGNPYLIGLQKLSAEGLLDPQELNDAPAEVTSDPGRVDFGVIYHWKLGILRRAVANLYLPNNEAKLKHFKEYCSKEAEWLNDYALFMALKDAHQGCAWTEWEQPLRDREPAALEQARQDYAKEIEAYCFMQWVFTIQWNALRSYANDNGIKILGDIPIFVAMDSADAWANPELFHFDMATKQPTCVAGVPPDYFALDGQLWGNPLYNWKAMKSKRYAWWIARFRSALARYDMVRIDHFRGFDEYWEVPAGAATARSGKWVKGPGADLFKALQKVFGNEHPIVAEDLGDITDSVYELRDKFKLPGMKVLQFAFGPGCWGGHPFLPHNYPENCIAYTGTHDNDTARGWYEQSSTNEERDHFRRYFATDGWDMAWTMIRGIFASHAKVAIVPVQDILDLGSQARMNKPGEPYGNWTWRIFPGQLNEFAANRLRDITLLYGRERNVRPNPNKSDDKKL